MKGFGRQRRIGGEEFAPVIPGASIEAAAVRADRIRAAFATGCHVVNDHLVSATVSSGVATSDPAQQLTLGALLESSDKALYRAKPPGAIGRARASGQRAEGGCDRGPPPYRRNGRCRVH